MRNIKNILASILVIPMLLIGVSFIMPASNVYAQSSISDGAQAARGEDTPDAIFGDGGVLQVVTNTILYALGAISVIMLIYGGIRYTVSGGDSAQVTAAKNTILYAIVGVVVALMAYAIINFVLESLIT